MAVQAVAPGRFEIVETPLPSIGPGEALVRYEVASICGSDLHICYLGWNVERWPLPPGYPGHEGVGDVIASRSKSFRPGDRVLAAPHIWNSFGFAMHQAVDDAHLLKLPSAGDAADLSMAQQLGTVIYAAKRLPALLGLTCVVMGQGSAGLYWNFVLKRLGATRVIAIEPLKHRRALAAAYGADEAVDVTGSAATEAVLDMTRGRGADLVVEAVGSTATLSHAFELVRDEGRVVLFGLPESDGEVPFNFNAFFRKRATAYTVLGSQDEPGLTSYRQALDWITGGLIDVGPIMSRRIPFEQAQQAFDMAQERAEGVVKVALAF